MPVMINHKICDKGKGCPCIAACPAKAWRFDKEKKMPIIDIPKCTNCGLCVKTCPARAVLFSYTDDGLEKLKEAIERDPRKKSEVSELRYGADPLDEKLSCTANKLEEELKKSNNIVLVELWSTTCTSRCRNNSPLYRDIVPTQSELKVLQVDVDFNPQVMQKYKAFTVPSLLVFYKNKLIDYIAGCSSIAETSILQARIANALNKIM